MAVVGAMMLEPTGGMTQHNTATVLAFADAYQGIRVPICIVTREAFNVLFPGDPAAVRDVEIEGIPVRIALPNAVAKF